VFVVVQLPAVEGTPLPPAGRHILHFAFLEAPAAAAADERIDVLFFSFKNIRISATHIITSEINKKLQNL